MKHILFLIGSVFSVLICNADSWTRKADFPGGSQENAIGFTIGDKAYVLCGLNELWEYSPDIDTWVQKSNPPFSTSNFPLGFGIGSYGYVFTGSANQFWQYNPLSDIWTRKEDLPGLLRSYPVYFVIGNKGYVGGGMSYVETGTSTIISYNGGFYSYDPATNSWDSLTNMPFVFTEANGFTANDKGYVTGILDTNSLSFSISPFVFEYNPLSNVWTEKANFTGIARVDASAFSIGSIGYFGIGDTGTGGVFKDLWQYNAYTDTWIFKDTIPCTNGKDQDASFSVNHKGYICFGSDLSPNAEIWEYTPDSVTAINDLTTRNIQANISPNPCTLILNIRINVRITQITITNLIGQTVFSNNYNKEEIQVDVSGLPNGMYFVTVNGTEVRRFLKQ